MNADHGFPARIYGPRVVEGGRTVRFEAFTDRLTARDDAGQVFTLNPGQVKIGRSGHGVSIEAADGSFALVVTDREGLLTLREDAPPDIREGVAEALGMVKKAAGKDRRWFLYSLIILVVLGWGLYIGLMAAAKVAVRELPLSFDREIGDLANISDILPDATPLSDEQVSAALAEIVARLEPHSLIEGFEYRIEVLDSPEVNAFALPGGRIFVLTGLIKAADSPEQVAGVLAHEMAHVTMRHGMRNIVQSLGMIVAVEVLIGDVAGLSVLAVEGARLLVLQGYSRELENEADVEGVRMMHEAGIDPRGLARFFELLQGEIGGPAMPAWLGSHPELGDRIATVEQLAADRGAIQVVPFTFDWEAVRAAVE